MCGPHAYPRIVKNERQQLQEAIERLEALKKVEWCGDALLVIGAARKHLATLPKSAKFRAWMARGGATARQVQLDFDTRADAIAWITVNLWAYDNFSIDEVE